MPTLVREPAVLNVLDHERKLARLSPALYWALVEDKAKYITSEDALDFATNYERMAKDEAYSSGKREVCQRRAERFFAHAVALESVGA